MSYDIWWIKRNRLYSKYFNDLILGQECEREDCLMKKMENWKYEVKFAMEHFAREVLSRGTIERKFKSLSEIMEDFKRNFRKLDQQDLVDYCSRVENRLEILRAEWNQEESS